MKKGLRLLIYLGIIVTISTNRVMASSISLTSSKSSVTKGSSVTIYSTVNSDSPLITVEGSLSCSGAGVTGGVDLNDENSDNTHYSSSKNITVKATSVGKITCTTSNTKITNLASGSWQSLTNASISIDVLAPATITPKTYSSNNYLKSLSVDGYEISFDKNTLEYSIEVSNDVKTVKINTQVEDSKASVNGNGDREVVEGTNKLEVKVIAENGNEKIYIINVNVKELDPIEVKVGKKKYTIIRKEGVIDAPSAYYEKTTIKIGEDEVLAYINNTSKITLIGLKDDKGNANYYIYKDGEYTLYNEYTFGNLVLYIKDFNKDDVILGSVKSSFKYDNKKINGYNIKDTKYYFIYAMNVQTGEDSVYLYDDKQNSIIRYDKNIFSISNSKDYYIYYIGGGIVLSVIIIVIAIILLDKPKKKKVKLNVK